MLGTCGCLPNCLANSLHPGGKRRGEEAAFKRDSRLGGRETTIQEAVGLRDSIAEFCRRANMAESTFGRRAVNDGKFVSRLRDGARITPETLVRVSDFLTTLGVCAPASPPELMPLLRVVPAPAAPVE